MTECILLSLMYWNAYICHFSTMRKEYYFTFPSHVGNRGIEMADAAARGVLLKINPFLMAILKKLINAL